MVNPLVDPARDRAARLRSSDAPEQKAKPTALGIPDAKDRDVVAVQLELFCQFGLFCESPVEASP